MELFVVGCISILCLCLIDAFRPKGYGPHNPDLHNSGLHNPRMGFGNGGMQNQPPPMQQQTQQHFPNSPDQGYNHQGRGRGSNTVWLILALLTIGTLLVLRSGIPT